MYVSMHICMHSYMYVRMYKWIYIWCVCGGGGTLLSSATANQNINHTMILPLVRQTSVEPSGVQTCVSLQGLLLQIPLL